MAEIALPLIVTAVADPAVEGFIASALFAQGWSVVFRALDLSSLKNFLESEASSQEEIILIYSPDLPGLQPESLVAYQGRVRHMVGFASDPAQHPQFLGLLKTPSGVAELLSCVRGFIRAPLVRSRNSRVAMKRRAKVIALASPPGSTGCTTIAINLAMEISIHEKEVLLVDADVRSPSIASLLSLHKLDLEAMARPIAPYLKASEFTQARLASLTPYLEYLLTNFDFVVIDLGSIHEIGDSLTDRRWSATMVHWACEMADEIIFVGLAGGVASARFEALTKSLTGLSIQARLSVLLNMKQPGRKGAAQEERFFKSTSILNPHRTIVLPKDAASLSKAELEKSTLLEVRERSPLRRAIAKLAQELQD